MSVAILFARHNSIYKTLPDCEVWDAQRDACLWPGGSPVVTHPPCAQWGRLRRFARQSEAEQQMAFFAIEQVREWGGVLEHPAASTLWPVAGLPEPGKRDAFGGWTLVVSQWWWGHKADKLTRLYICGIEPADIPTIPYRIGEPEYVVSTTRGNTGKREITKSEREHTPIEFAKWLVDLASRAKTKGATALECAPEKAAASSPA